MKRRSPANDITTPNHHHHHVKRELQSRRSFKEEPKDAGEEEDPIALSPITEYILYHTSL